MEPNYPILSYLKEYIKHLHHKPGASNLSTETEYFFFAHINLDFSIFENSRKTEKKY